MGNWRVRGLYCNDIRDCYPPAHAFSKFKWEIGFTGPPDEVVKLVPTFCEEHNIDFHRLGRYFVFENETDATLVYMAFQ